MIAPTESARLIARRRAAWCWAILIACGTFDLAVIAAVWTWLHLIPAQPVVLRAPAQKCPPPGPAYFQSCHPADTPHPPTKRNAP